MFWSTWGAQEAAGGWSPTVWGGPAMGPGAQLGHEGILAAKKGVTRQSTVGNHHKTQQGIKQCLMTWVAHHETPWQQQAGKREK